MEEECVDKVKLRSDELVDARRNIVPKRTTRTACR